MRFSLHTHSQFCDGKTDMEQVCQRAIDEHFEVIGFSSHAPVPIETFWAMPFERLLAYKQELRRCQQMFGDQLQIYRALEADYMPGLTPAFSEWRRLLDLDYVIGSVHLILNPANGKIMGLDGTPDNYDQGLKEAFNGDIKKAVECYYQRIQEMVINEKPEIIGHLDKVVMNNQGRYFSPDDDWHRELVEQTLQVIKKEGGIIEVNSRGVYRKRYHTWFPCDWIIKRCVEINIPLTISVDAHHADELLSGFDDMAEVIQQAGANHFSCFKDSRWKQIPISAVLGDRKSE